MYDGTTQHAPLPYKFTGKERDTESGLICPLASRTESYEMQSAAHYSPAGALASLTNGASIASTFLFNSRLQPCWVYATTGTPLPWNSSSTNCASTAATGSLLDLKYNFNLGASDNGNVMCITNNITPSLSPNFTYDSLNRISTAQTTGTYATSPTNCWAETYSYDAWANLLKLGPNSSTQSAYTGCSQESGFDYTNFTSTKNQITYTGFSYDTAGDLMTPPGAGTVTYNAENQSVSAGGVNYLYDGDGKRVQKSNGKLYWYGMSSDPLDETDLQGNTNNSSFFEYIFFGGQRIARRDYQNNVNYYFADHLGTSRIVTNSSGSILDDSDFYPFGGERSYTNACPQNYKFEGKERDTETGNDDFGARYYSNRFGRWLSADWSAIPVPVPYANLTNPQTLNLYAMVRDNPETFADLDGHCDGEHCDRITVSAKISKEPEVTSSKNGRVSTATVEAEVQYTIKQNGKPMADTPIHEEVSNKVTRNGTPEQSKTKTRDDSTNKQGVIGDTTSHTISTNAPSLPGTNLAEQILTTSTISKETTQTLTIGNTGCQVTEARTLSNKDGDYTLTLQSPKTQKATPVPTPPPPPKPPTP